MNEIITIIREWIENKKSGSLQINFYAGGISSVNVNETIKLDKEFNKKNKYNGVVNAQ